VATVVTDGRRLSKRRSASLDVQRKSVDVFWMRIHNAPVIGKRHATVKCVYSNYCNYATAPFLGK